ncbi:MAG: Stk1 family PASTA domain-containing Ser/Thr kinase [Candidatus Eremiobacteraeota bacterium]|nr:Stk1 family PASTA domain-containing Ser/Thr kinase [Candidatus Eremiobacteraeota bacterium]
MIEEQTFNNRYKLDRKLGEGGMATVYSGTDTVLRRRVAVKVLRPQYASDAEFVRRFYQEAESVARLSHPNIVNTYDVGREGDTYYIVMELIDGPSLGEIIAADGRLPEPVAIDYAAQICSGLAYAHRTGLLHRDIKPANILVTKDDVVKLSDFGIARAVSQHTMTLTKPGLVMGSVFYISPEQAQGHELGEASDLYSVGVVLYQMLTGTLPYSGESPVTVALKHIGDPVPTIDTRSSGISPALGAIVNKLLQKQPQNRFESASEVASALREARERPTHAAHHIANDAPTAAFGAVPPPRRSPLPDNRYTSLSEDEERRSRFGSGAVAVLAVLAVVATAVGYMLFGRPIALPSLASTITVNDYSKMTDVQAQQSVVNAGLQAREIKIASDTVPSDHVIRQNPEPGSKVESNSVVELFVSNGLPLFGLRDVRGYSAADATRTLQDDKFEVKLNRRYSSDPKDSVIEQQPDAGSKVRQGSTVSLVVSNGPQPVAAPNFVGMNVDDATALAKKDGIALDTSGREPSAGYANNIVAAQDVAPGQTLEHNTTIHATVSTGASTNVGPSVAIPNVVSMNYAQAISQLNGGGFSAAIKFAIQSQNNGEIIAQDPAPAVQASSGATVTVTLSVSGEVPDTEGLSMADAQATLLQNGYRIDKVKYTNEGADGKVVRTQPEAGTGLAPGSFVTVVVNGVQR